jgi:hypothetical protein
MAEPARLTLRRALTREQADGLVGELVSDDRAAIRVIDPTIVVDPELGEPVFAYLPLPDGWVGALTKAVLAIDDFTGIARAGKLRSLSRTFGMAPRRPTMKHDSCRITSLARDMPEVHNTLAMLSLHLGDMLRSFAPAIAERDVLTIGEIDDDWRMAPHSHWTSGVVNHTAQLPYHRDGMNFDAWSAMPVIRSGVSGGGLHLPEYGLTASCRNGYVVFFNGFRLVHGVTPLTYIRPAKGGQPKGYRFSIVYYALRGMKDCATFAAELAQGQAKRTEREENQRAVVSGEKSWR